MVSQDSWIDRTRRAVERRLEALEFLSRVRDQFPMSSPLHAAAVTRLWSAAEEMDPPVCRLLEELNQGLLQGTGQLDITRGASLRAQTEMERMGIPASKGPTPGTPLSQETLVYECTWALLWKDAQKGIRVALAIDTQTMALDARVSARQWPMSQELSHPIDEEALKEALTEVFVAESTLDQVTAQLQQITHDLADQDAALQRVAGIDLTDTKAPQTSKTGKRVGRPKGK